MEPRFKPNDIVVNNAGRVMRVVGNTIAQDEETRVEVSYEGRSSYLESELEHADLGAHEKIRELQREVEDERASAKASAAEASTAHDYLNRERDAAADRERALKAQIRTLEQSLASERRNNPFKASAAKPAAKKRK